MIRLLFACAFIFFTDAVFAQEIPPRPLSIGEIRTLKSSILNEDRRLNIYLPDGYDAKKTYSVIYLLDGSMNEDFLHVVGLVQFFNLMFTMPETIVVGIENVDRRRDFTFHTDLKELQTDFPTTGHSDKFIAFLESELLPYISANYNTNDEKFLIGQSLGGLLACEILVNKPHLFSHYLVVSPSLWWDDESLVKRASSSIAKPDYAGKYIYVSVGDKEEKVMQKDAADFFQIISKPAKGAKSDYVLLPGESHATILHQSLYKAFAKLYKPRY